MHGISYQGLHGILNLAQSGEIIVKIVIIP